MGAHQSRDQALYNHAKCGNVAGIKALRQHGAGLEWVDKERRTPLILACMRSDLLPVAKVLIELGANVNAYRPGSQGGTPLHYAAKRGLVQTVELLLSRGANPLLMNDDHKTALDLARANGHLNIVRSIENSICLFSGWLRELHGPSILEALIPHWVSRKLYVHFELVHSCSFSFPSRHHLVEYFYLNHPFLFPTGGLWFFPFSSPIPTNPPRFYLALYSGLQVAKPRTTVALWKCQIDEPRFTQPDPTMLIECVAGKLKFRLSSGVEGDRQQLLLFYNACRGIPRTSINVPAPPVISVAPMPTTAQINPQPSSTLPSTLPTSTTPTREDEEISMAIHASIQSAMAEGVVPISDTLPPLSPSSVPSAPPINSTVFYNNSINYPSVDSHPTNVNASPLDTRPDIISNTSNSSSSCVICLDGPVEGACIPCGHMAGCMSCLNEIKAKQWGCPICRTQIQQVIKLYAV
ncbi:probable E3 ubiquitin-protein ligase XBOS34 [Dioscorea cayenensis subsp. rotundata]|uniref:Probable E3 ubiquitin-protein ligase XBOS34 n=1 Tax=Dioscorea cayennensis subsp. rotundata TaxID=55577 RepID=A0AB40CDW1_DIOCR|nr:probable E3 ubiquitin-protein ligase XBOS34 [Dioscorea cayenensis subsp. rotundata]